MTENREKRTPLIPLMNEGLGELMCRRHFFILKDKNCYELLSASTRKGVLGNVKLCSEYCKICILKMKILHIVKCDE